MRGHFEIAAFLLDHLLDIRGFLFRIRHRRRGELAQKFVHRPDTAGRLVLQLIGGVGRIPEQLGSLRPQGDDLLDRFPVVELPAPAVPRKGRLHDLLAQGTILQGRKGGLLGGVQEMDDELARLLVLLRGRRRRRDFILGQTGQVSLLVDHDREGVLLLQDILGETGLESGQL